MPRKKPVEIIDPDLDHFVELGPVPNGHDHDDTDYLDAPLDMPLDEPVRHRKSRMKTARPEAKTEGPEEPALSVEKGPHPDESLQQTEDIEGQGSRQRPGTQETETEGRRPEKPKSVKTKVRAARKRQFDDDDDKVLKLPLLPLRDMVIFPHMVTSLFVGREKSIKAIEAALNSDRIVYAVAQRNPEEEDIGPDDLHTMGVELVIGRSLKMPDGTVSLLVQGQRRIKLLRYLRTEPYIRILGEAYEDANETSQPTQALMRAVLALFEKVVKLSRNLSEESYVAAMNVDEPGWLADLIASTITLDQESRQQLLESIDPIERLQSLSLMLAKELDVLDLENRIQDRVQNEVDKSQRSEEH